MNTISDPATPAPATDPPAAVPQSWPVTVLTWFISVFVVFSLGFVATAPLRGEALGDTAVVVLIACALRLLTVAMAQAAIRPWGRRVPGWLLLGGLFGAAAAQIAYPAAEVVIKMLVVLGFQEATEMGIASLTAIAWFNLALTVLIWGLPGWLIGRTALQYRRFTGLPRYWLFLGAGGGLGFLLLLGLLIG